jgi:hypothetical protein
MGRGQERTTSVESPQPRVTARMVRSLAIQALQNSDFRDVLDVMGTDPGEGAAGVAFKTMVAESVAECAIRALREAKRRKTRMGAAAIIIAAEKR